jgi:hypothetical protein
MLEVLFFILKATIPSPLCSSIKAKVCSCLAEIAFIRHSVFTSTDTRIEFVKLFASCMVSVLQSPAKGMYILKDRQIYKEFVRIPHKFETNFQIRDLNKLGDAALEGYL